MTDERTETAKATGTDVAAEAICEAKAAGMPQAADMAGATGANGVVELELPLGPEALASLKCGQAVRLSGKMYTMRDAGHERCLAHLREYGELPFGLAGQALIYAGPTPPAAGRPFGAMGPTTASRMDFATPELMDAGIVATIGKGKRSDAVREACVRSGGVYLAAVGGIAALLAECVESARVVAWEDLGTEALREIVVRGLPAYVAIDARGRELYA